MRSRLTVVLFLLGNHLSRLQLYLCEKNSDETLSQKEATGTSLEPETATQRDPRLGNDTAQARPTPGSNPQGQAPNNNKTNNPRTEAHPNKGAPRPGGQE